MEENHNVEDMDVDTPPPIRPQPPQHQPIPHLQKVKDDQTPKRSRKPSARSINTLRHNHQHRHNFSDDDDDHGNHSEDEDDTMGDESKGTSNNTTQHTPPSSPVKSLNSSASPVGVNRRTAVLFTRKAQAALKRPTDTSTSATATPVKEENHNVITNASQISTLGSLITAVNNSASSTSASVTSSSLITSALSISNKLSGGLNQLSPLSASLNQVSSSLTVKSPKRNARHRRLNEMRNSGSVSPKKSPNRTLTGLLTTAAAALPTSAQSATALNSATPTISLPPATSLSSYQHIPDTFRVYRTNNERDASDSDDDDMSDISGSPCSSCSGITGSGTGSDYDSSDDDDDDEDEEDDDEEDDTEAQNADDNNSRDKPDIEMNDSTTIGESATGGNNGQAMSCSGDSDTDGAVAPAGRISRAGNDSDTQTRSISRRTPTPLDKKQRSVGRPRTKKKTASPAPARNPTSTPPPTATLPVKAATRSASNKPATRTATPTPNNVNSMKTRKAHNAALANANNSSMNSRSKSNHINSSSAAATTAALDMANSNSTADNLLKPPLEPLQLVWAKCRGYPWYPALILDPKTPKGFVYNGVPLPAPPSDVLALRKNYPQDVEVFLVLFFDAKRTWQWLPANKLDILGIDKELDQQKLVESRKPTERKAVKKAYQDALHYQSQVSDLEGQGPDPIM
uniref:PWWP domain protein n=1 Tax=Musca domestica TaxID=7370 RepID=T1P900_MUSDO